MSDPDAIPLRDGITTPGSPAYFVTARGGVREFVVLRADTWDDTGFSPKAVIVSASGGLYEPDSCFIGRERAEAEAARRRASRRRWAEGVLGEDGAD